MREEKKDLDEGGAGRDLSSSSSAFSTPMHCNVYHEYVAGGTEKEEHLSLEKGREKVQPARPLLRCC